MHDTEDWKRLIGKEFGVYENTAPMWLRHQREMERSRKALLRGIGYGLLLIGVPYILFAWWWFR